MRNEKGKRVFGMIIKLSGNYEEIKEGLTVLAPICGFSVDKSGRELWVQKNIDNKMIVAMENDVCRISYDKKADFFRGLMILLDQLKKGTEKFYKEEKRKLSSNGIMITVRYAVMKVETLKDFIRRMAQMGLDSLYLYMEDTYKMEKYPYFGYMHGAYSKEELKEIDAYGCMFGVEVIPAIQTLGHLQCTLRWRYTREMRDTEKSLMVGAEETYEFIEEMFKTLRECFTTKRIHIGMDEAYQVGKGAYLKKHGLRNPYDIFSEHLDKVVSIVKKYEFEPMIWSDMYLTLGSKTGKQYDPECTLPENIQEMVLEELSLVYWDYFAEDAADYDTMFALHRKMGRNIVFAGAVWQWSNVVVNYGRTFRISRAALEACYRNGVKDVFMTSWAGAADASYYQTLLAMQLYAEYSYAAEVSNEQIWEMFRVCTGLDPDAFLALDCDDFLSCKTLSGDDKFIPEMLAKIDPIWKSVQLSAQLLYQDVMYGIFDENYKALDVESMYSDCLKRLQALPDQGEMEYIFNYQRKMLEVLLKKCRITVKLYEAYHAKDMEKLAELRDVLILLREKVKKLYDLHVGIWLRNYKAFGLEVSAERFGTLMLRLENAAKRVDDYLNGRIDRIEELEEKRLKYTNHTVNHEEDIVYDEIYSHIAFIP